MTQNALTMQWLQQAKQRLVSNATPMIYGQFFTAILITMAALAHIHSVEESQQVVATVELCILWCKILAFPFPCEIR